MHDADKTLAGRCILVVEDEMLLAMDLQMLLESEGCTVLPPVPSVDGALDALAQCRPDAVTLDMNLKGESSAPVAAKLREMAVPFVVVSGNGGKSMDEPMFQEVPLVDKPYSIPDLLRKLSGILK